MRAELEKVLLEKGADIVRFVDVSRFSSSALGFDKAILFCMGLSRQFVLDIYNDVPTQSDEFLEKEHDVEALADWLAQYINEQGYGAYSQSEKNNAQNGYVECAYFTPEIQQGLSIVPQKTIARLAGLGFIGKNNLLVSEQYGCAFTMCSVLTDMPIFVSNPPIVPVKCGDCAECVKACSAKALTGNKWTAEGGRESVVDVAKCCCALRCMMACPYSLAYARRVG